jgi:flagellar biosynthesis protein
VTRAAALKYEAGEMHAPQVVARGEGRIAEEIIAAARRHGIPMHQSPDLVQLLTRLPAESTIPPELYLAVAEVLVFLVRTADAAAGHDESRAGC